MKDTAQQPTNFYLSKEAIRHHLTEEDRREAEDTHQPTPFLGGSTDMYWQYKGAKPSAEVLMQDW